MWGFFETSDGKPRRFWEKAAVFGYLVGLIAIGCFAAAKSSLTAFAVLWVVGTAAWLAGTALGFIFGVPRVRTAEQTQADVNALGDSNSIVVPNTNLEQISDWLTKIIVGATLVQLGQIAEELNELSLAIGRGLGGSEDNLVYATVSGGVIVFFFCAGFLWGYLWCSLRVYLEMRRVVNEG